MGKTLFLTQFILESHSWEPEDTDNISEFLSYLFFICKELICDTITN